MNPSSSTGERRSIDTILERARSQLERIEPELLEREHANGALIVDIRPVEQRTTDGHPML